MRVINRLSVLILFLLVPGNIFAYEAKDIVSPDIYKELKKNEVIQRSLYKKVNPKFTLTPDNDLCRLLTQQWPSDNEDPALLIENLYLLSKKDFGTGNPEKTTIEYASKVLRMISKMDKMKYYSSRRKYEQLYDGYYRIAGPKDRTPLPDDIEGNADGKIMYCMHNDNSFGKINYRLEYHQKENQVSVSYINTTPVWVGPIKAIDPDNLRISLIVLDCNEDMMVYLIIQAKFPALSILENKMNESLASRLDAIYNWFKTQF